MPAAVCHVPTTFEDKPTYLRVGHMATFGSRPPSEALRPISGSTPIGMSSEPLQHTKSNRMQDLRECWARPASKLCCLAILVLLIAAVIVAVVVTQALALPAQLSWEWTAPELLRKGSTNPNHFQMQVADQQVRVEQQGATPFSSNFVSVIDFRTNKIAIVDSSLRTGGANMICFVVNLDHGDIRSLENFQRAARNGANKRIQSNGWQEQWNFIASSVQNPAIPAQYFKPEITECRGARWVEVTFTNAYQKNFKCAECYDFCLPHYFIDHDNIRDETYLNVKQRDCFYMFVPEWRGFAQGRERNDQSIPSIPRLPEPVPQNVPLSQLLNQPLQKSLQNLQVQQQQRQQIAPFNQFGAVGGGDSGLALQGGIIETVQGGRQIDQTIDPTIQRALQTGENMVQSHWINLQKAPDTLVNYSREALSNLKTNVNQWGQTIFGINDARNYAAVPRTPPEYYGNPMTGSGVAVASKPQLGQIPFTARNIDSSPSQFNQLQQTLSDDQHHPLTPKVALHDPGTAFQSQGLINPNRVVGWNSQTGWTQSDPQQKNGLSFGRDLSVPSPQQQTTMTYNTWMNTNQG